MKYLEGSDMTQDDIWKTNRHAGAIFEFLRNILSYIEVNTI